jgi:trimethylguanosine synthase
MCSNDEEECSVCTLPEDLLFPAGVKNRHLLVRVSRVNVAIRLALLKKELSKKQRSEKIEQKMEQRKYREYEFNKHWEQRYILFEKFDEGIKIDENSWTVNPPEQVSEYIASKCNGAKIVLDAYAGVGGNTIKLANINSCVKVIANEESEEKMRFLLNNSKVYEVDSNVELSEG